jgi:nickel/cobalt exporter
MIESYPLFAHLDHSSLFVSLVDNDLTSETLLTGVAIAIGLGAFHALSPGHGKTLVSSYLIGTRGTPIHALILGLTVSLTHTIGVIALGLITLFASQYFLSEQLYPLLSIISGLTVLGVGIWLVYRLLTYRNHADHHHHHYHTQAESVTSSSLIALGIAGGLVPCPSALVILLTAVSLHKTAYGLLLTGSFSVGLALILIILGLLAVYARQWLENFSLSGFWLRRLSFSSALLVVFIGSGLTLLAVKNIM